MVINHCYFSETGSRPNLQESLRGLKLTQQQEDFELKKGLLCLLCSLSGDHTAAKVMAEEKVIRSLLSFVTRNDKVESSLWNPAQFEELQLLVSVPTSMHVLSVVMVTASFFFSIGSLVSVFSGSPVY